MKIIRKDNLDRDSISEVLICENVNPHYATKIIDSLNGEENSSDWFKAVPDDYTLYEFKP